MWTSIDMVRANLRNEERKSKSFIALWPWAAFRWPIEYEIQLRPHHEGAFTIGFVRYTREIDTASWRARKKNINIVNHWHRSHCYLQTNVLRSKGMWSLRVHVAILFPLGRSSENICVRVRCQRTKKMDMKEKKWTKQMPQYALTHAFVSVVLKWIISTGTKSRWKKQFHFVSAFNKPHNSKCRWKKTPHLILMETRIHSVSFDSCPIRNFRRTNPSTATIWFQIKWYAI